MVADAANQVQVSVVSSLLSESSSKDTRLPVATMAFVLQNHVASGFIYEVNYGSGGTRRLFINTEEKLRAYNTLFIAHLVCFCVNKLVRVTSLGNVHL